MSKKLIIYRSESNFIDVAVKVIEKLYNDNENVLFLCLTEEEVKAYNQKLWTYSQLSFIPSGNIYDMHIEDAVYCHTWFSTNIVFDNHPVVLLHNGINIDIYPDIDKFNKIIDIAIKSKNQDISDIIKKYKTAGFNDQKVWIQRGKTWEQGEAI